MNNEQYFLEYYHIHLVIIYTMDSSVHRELEYIMHLDFLL